MAPSRTLLHGPPLLTLQLQPLLHQLCRNRGSPNSAEPLSWELQGSNLAWPQQCQGTLLSCHTTAVGNEADFAKFMPDGDAYRNFRADLRLAMPRLQDATINDYLYMAESPPLAHNPDANLIPSEYGWVITDSNRFRRLPPITADANECVPTCCMYTLLQNIRRPPDTATPTFESAEEEQEAMNLAALEAFIQVHPSGAAPCLRHNYTKIAYTDGSILGVERDGQGHTAAAVYLPPSDGDLDIDEDGYQARAPRCIAIFCQLERDPTEVAGFNGINRAELAGILVAIQQNIGKSELHIATDSLTSIYQSFRELTRYD